MSTEVAVHGDFAAHKDDSVVADVRKHGAIMTINGLTLLTDEITPEKFEALLWYLVTLRESIYWSLGDGWFQAEALWGEEVYQYMEIMRISAESIRQYIRVAGDVPQRRRRIELSWSHHREVAPLHDEWEQVVCLQYAVENRWTKQELAAAIKEAKGIPEKPRRPYVMEQVCDAAQHIWDAVPLDEDAIPDWLRPPLEELADALGETV